MRGDTVRSANRGRFLCVYYWLTRTRHGARQLPPKLEFVCAVQVGIGRDFFLCFELKIKEDTEMIEMGTALRDTKKQEQ